MKLKGRRIWVVADLHVPYLDDEALEWAIQQGEEFEPEAVVVLGDLWDFEGLSRFYSEPGSDFIEDVVQGGSVLEKIRARLSSTATEFILAEGNHEFRARRKCHEIPKYMRSALDFKRHHTEFAHWKHLPYEKSRAGIIEAGPFLMWHGFRCGGNGGEMECFDLAGIMPDKSEFVLVRGHEHMPIPIRQARKSPGCWSPYWYIQLGTLADVSKLEYAHQQNTHWWKPTVLLAEWDTDGSYSTVLAS